MLFDLKSGKRRRVVQIVFGGLAVIFAASFLFFGIGSDAQGGLADLFGIGSSDQGSSDPQFEDDIERAEERLAENPNDRNALLSLARTYYQAGNTALAGDEETGAIEVTEEAVSHYTNAVDAWERYLATDPNQIDTGTGNLALFAYDYALQGVAITDPGFEETLAGWLETAQVLADDDPTLRNLQALAQAAYVNGETKLGDDAAKRALAQADPGQRQSLEQIFRFAKQAPEQIEQAQKAGAPSEEEIVSPFGGQGAPGGIGQPAP